MTFEQLVSRMVSDRKFREGVARDPEGTLKSAGVTPTPEMVSALRRVDYGALKQVGKSFGQADSCEGGLLTS
ncbi:MAG TPA: Os1348 family NHLP clan protein [Gemmatimonadales bacterium]|jgi:hypothetical protein